MALSAKVVDFIGSNAVNKIGELGAIREVAVMEEEPGGRLMGVNVDMVDARGAESARPSDNTVHFVSFTQQKLSQVRAILPCYASDQCFFHRSPPENSRGQS
jgi:hypothetical protein